MEPGYITEKNVLNTETSSLRSDKAIKEIRLFLMNQLTLTHVESEFCMCRIWNKVYSMLTHVKSLPAAPVVMIL